MSYIPNPTQDPQLRSRLLDYFIESQSAAELADWLRDLGVSPAGSIQERRERVRAHTQYLAMPAREFPAQTRHYLDPFSSDGLADLCLALGLRDTGTRDSRYRRIMREVKYRECWLPRVPPTIDPLPDVEVAAAFLQHYPITSPGQLERDYYEGIRDELSEVFGENGVYEQLPIAHGTTLKIDFHLGPPQQDGIGIEVKMPKSNAEVQRSLGQLDQYLHRYGQKLIILCLPDFLPPASMVFFQNELRAKGVRTVVKSADDP